MGGFKIENNELVVMYGSRPGEMVPRILDRLGVEGEVSRDSLIGLKPNLVVAKESSSGATTDPALTAAVIEYFKGKGYHNMVILESSWIGDSTGRAFKACGYQDISRKYGVPMVDLKKDGYREIRAGDLFLKVCKKALEVDYLINLPVLKAHCQTRITCALKNLKGCIPDSEKRRYHALGLHKPIALLNTVLKSHLTIVDGIIGDLVFEEGGTPVRMDRIIAGRDPVLVDSYSAKLLGYTKEDIRYIIEAEALGAGNGDLSNAVITKLNKGDGVREDFAGYRRAFSYSKYIIEKQACSACYGSLIHALERLREKGRLERLDSKICIGQGFKGKRLNGIGVGSCTRGCSGFVPGCPPETWDIVKHLEDSMD